MRILLLVHSFNGLAQRLHVELIERGHQISVEFDINDDVMREAVALFDPYNRLRFFQPERNAAS